MMCSRGTAASVESKESRLSPTSQGMNGFQDLGLQMTDIGAAGMLGVINARCTSARVADHRFPEGHEGLI